MSRSCYGTQTAESLSTFTLGVKLSSRSADFSAVKQLQPGSVFGGRYAVLERIGKGGMGSVYKVRDRELDRVVALKVIRSELTDQPEILQRLPHRPYQIPNVLRGFRLVIPENTNRYYSCGEVLIQIASREGLPKVFGRLYYLISDGAALELRRNRYRLSQ